MNQNPFPLNNEISQFMNQNLLAPFIFIFMCILMFLFLGAVLYYRFLNPWIPEKLASLAGFAGSAYILMTCVNHYEKIKGLVASWNVTTMIIVMFFFIVTIGVVIRLIPSKKKKREKKQPENQISILNPNDCIQSKVDLIKRY